MARERGCPGPDGALPQGHTLRDRHSPDTLGHRSVVPTLSLIQSKRAQTQQQHATTGSRTQLLSHPAASSARAQPLPASGGAAPAAPLSPSSGRAQALAPATPAASAKTVAGAPPPPGPNQPPSPASPSRPASPPAAASPPPTHATPPTGEGFSLLFPAAHSPPAPTLHSQRSGPVPGGAASVGQGVRGGHEVPTQPRGHVAATLRGLAPRSRDDEEEMLARALAVSMQGWQAG
ncbi:MAG: hypothetical protein WDW38_008330 [Sanguina aurantia]